MATMAQHRKFLLELAVATLLSTLYFFFVKNYAVGIPSNTTNGTVFTAGSVSHFQLPHIYDVWKGRLSGLLLSGYLFDFLVNHSSGSFEQYSIVFGLYQAVWLFVLFLVVILALRHAWLVNLGIFAGVMYNFLPAGGLYFYPWDLPATVFFTLAVLLFGGRQMGLMVAAVCAGCFFKETVLVCGGLVLFAGQWSWWKRSLTVAGLVLVYVLGKPFLLSRLHIPVAALSMNDAKTLAEVLSPRVLEENLKTLCSLQGLYVVLANAGTMVAVLLLGWQRRFLPYMIVILAFLAGQAMYGDFLEFRIFMQILPLSLMLLGERWVGRPPRKAVASAPETPSPEAGSLTGMMRPTLWPLKATATLLIGLSTVLVAWRLGVVWAKGGTTERGSKYLTSDEGIKQLETVAAWFKQGREDVALKLSKPLKNQEARQRLGTARNWFGVNYAETEGKLASMLAIAGRDSEAYEHFCNAKGGIGAYYTNAITANNFAWLLATASDSHLRNGYEAVQLALMACEATHYEDPSMLGTLGAAYAEAGRFDEAIVAGRKARQLALETGQKDIASKNEELLQWYEAGKAYHEAGEAGPPSTSQ